MDDEDERFWSGLRAWPPAYVRICADALLRAVAAHPHTRITRFFI